MAHSEASQLKGELKLGVSSGVKQKIALITLSLLVSSCTVSQETNSPAISLSTPDYDSYLNMVRKKVLSNWKFPSGVSGPQAVTLRFVLDIDGKLMSVEVANTTDARLSGSAIEAMNRASPFPRIPENLKKLAGEPMAMKFSVSTQRKESP